MTISIRKGTQEILLDELIFIKVNNNEYGFTSNFLIQYLLKILPTQEYGSEQQEADVP